MTIDDIARTCHEVNRAYCASLGDLSQLPWGEAPAWQRAAAIENVHLHLERRRQGVPASPEESHRHWLREKQAAGWRHGPVKDPTTREHPSMVPYAELPAEERTKDALFAAVVGALGHLTPPSARE